MRKHSEPTRKYLLLASVLMLMLVLCGCRTRLTNNTEVTATIDDEDGTLTGNYEMRRDELGMPVAQKPLFTGWSSGDEDIDEYVDDGTLGTLEPYEDDGYVEPDEPSGSDSGSGSDSSSGNKTSGNKTSPVKPSGGSSTSKAETVKITFDLNDSSGTKNTLTVKKNTLYGDLPVGEPPEGYVFVEWTTDKANKKPVNKKAKITKSQTLYAHWKEVPVEVVDYKLTWEYDSDVEVKDAGSLPATTKDGKYPDTLPTAHKKNYRFLGWDNGSGLITPGQQCTGDSRLVAKFDSWEKIYNDEKPADDQKVTYNSEEFTDKLVRGNAWDDTSDTGPDYVILKFDGDDFNDEDAATQATQYKATAGAKYDRSVIIVIPKNATDDSNKLYYRLLIHNTMYGGPDLSKAAEDTETEATGYYVKKPE